MFADFLEKLHQQRTLLRQEERGDVVFDAILPIALVLAAVGFMISTQNPYVWLGCAAVIFLMQLWAMKCKDGMLISLYLGATLVASLLHVFKFG